MSLFEAKFELGKLRDGGIVMICNQDFPSKVKQVEYYADAKIFILTFYSLVENERDIMIQYEVSEKTSVTIEESEKDTILLVSALNRDALKGYDVPFIKSGIRQDKDEVA